nr:MAG TPA: DNA polymerase III, alpha subunit [Caudoviricetes sp.]
MFDGFNSSHTLAYSIVGLQEANLAYHYPVIYWNTANLISDSGGEDGNTNYGKISKAIGNIKKEGVTVALPDVNRVRFGFHPDVEHNEIVYGLKPIQGIGTNIAKAIIDNQKYTSMWDFYDKMQKYKAEAKENKFGNTAMISLIKAGCFDNVEQRDRREIMADFIRFISSPIKSLSTDNIEDLAKLNLLTDDQKKYELRLYRFRKYVFQKQFFYKQLGKSPNTAFYTLERKFAYPFFEKYFLNDMTEGKDWDYADNGEVIVKRGSLDRVFKKLMADFKEKVLDNPKMLEAVNESKFNEVWDANASGTISKWEMDSLCMYYHDHELANVDRKLYSIVDFATLPEEPEVAYKYYWRDQEKARFKLVRVCGTVLDKDKNRNTVTLLTPDGVCDLKFYKGQFQFYDKQIAQQNDDGTKTVLEKSWFQRGNKLLITGFRRGENFVPRQYKDSIFKHSVQMIKDINDDGSLQLISDRVEVDGSDEQ